MLLPLLVQNMNDMQSEVAREKACALSRMSPAIRSAFKQQVEEIPDSLWAFSASISSYFAERGLTPAYVSQTQITEEKDGDTTTTSIQTTGSDPKYNPAYFKTGSDYVKAFWQSFCSIVISPDKPIPGRSRFIEACLDRKLDIQRQFDEIGSLHLENVEGIADQLTSAGEDAWLKKVPDVNVSYLNGNQLNVVQAGAIHLFSVPLGLTMTGQIPPNPLIQLGPGGGFYQAIVQENVGKLNYFPLITTGHRNGPPQIVNAFSTLPSDVTPEEAAGMTGPADSFQSIFQAPGN